MCVFQNGCKVEWSYVDICKMSLLTPDEVEKAVSSTAPMDDCGTKLVSVSLKLQYLEIKLVI